MDFHSKISEYFDRLIGNSELSHAYLFSGEAGVGKFSFAKNLALKIAQKQNPEIKNAGPDLLIVEKEADKTQILIEQVRQINAFLGLRPQTIEKRIVIIRNANLLNTEAQNALLKTIEEPPPDSLIILTTNLEEKILATIKSRLLKIIFHPIAPNLIKEFLQSYDLEPQNIEIVVKFSAGRIGRVIFIKDHFSELRQNISDFQNFLNGGIKEKFSLIEKIAKDNEKINWFMTEMIFFLRNNLVALPAIENSRILRYFLNTKSLLENTNANPRLQLETLALMISI